MLKEHVGIILILNLLYFSFVLYSDVQKLKFTIFSSQTRIKIEFSRETLSNIVPYKKNELIMFVESMYNHPFNGLKQLFTNSC